MPFSEEGALSYCRWLTRVAQSNFALGLRVLPPPRREAMEVVYAFCRAVDDVVDREASRRNGSGEQAQRELGRWRRELEASANGFPTHPIAVALQPVLEKYQIPLHHCQAIIDGVEMDLTRRRYATFEELRGYCEHVASAVGLISIRVFGCQHPAAQTYAVDLGIALQLTNILRDLKTDGERGRIYLPLEELKQWGTSEEELLQGRPGESFRRLMAFQCERAHSFFKQADAALKETNEKRQLLPARIMGGVYARLLSRIEQRQYDVFSQRIAVPRSEQVLIAAREIFL